MRMQFVHVSVTNKYLEFGEFDFGGYLWDWWLSESTMRIVIGHDYPLHRTNH